MFLGMTLWFSATAVTLPVSLEFHLTAAETAWLTMAVQAGFVAGTLVSAVLNLPDVVNARYLFGAGCLLGGVANAAIAWAGGPVTLIALRLVTGFALALVYPPGMKIAAGWFLARRGTALGILIGALTVGSAFPHLLAIFSARVAWRTMVVVASTLGFAGGALVITQVGDGPYVTRSSAFDPRAIVRVFSERGTRLATFGYLGHMWELYAVWTWIAAFAGTALRSTRAGSALAFLTIASGAGGSVLAGLVADRVGKARVAMLAMIVSAACAAAAGLLFPAGLIALVVLGVVWGVAVVADSAQLSALVAEHSPRDHVGTALTVQTCAGFLLTMASIRLVPVVARAVGWQWAFVCLVPGPVLGAVAVAGLRRPPR